MPVKFKHPDTGVEQDLYSQEELSAAENAVRTTEKAKLYSDIEREKSAKVKATQDLEAAQNRLRTLETAEAARLAAAANNGATPPIADPARTQELSDLHKQVTSLETKIAEISGNVESIIHRAVNESNENFTRILTQKDQKVSVDLHRQQAIAAAGGKIIATMVTGDTIEAVNASVEAAKAEYTRISTAVIAEHLPVPTNVGNNGTGSDGTSLTGDTTSVSDFRKLNSAERAKLIDAEKARVFADLGIRRK